MTRHHSLLLSIIGLSTLSACDVQLSELEPKSAECPIAACTDSDDLDGDSIADCEDTDMDGDGLRNIWDAAPRDGSVATVLPGGLGTGGDLVIDAVTTLDVAQTLLSGAALAGDTILQVEDASPFVEGDEILVLSMQGKGAGAHHSAYVAAVGDSTLSIEPKLTEDITGDVVLVQRVPGYTSVTVSKGGELSTWDWSGEGGGVLALRATGAIEIDGAVVADGAGFTGAADVTSSALRPDQGESWTGLGVSVTETFGTANAGGGGAAWADDSEVSAASSGGGGAYGSDGAEGLWEDDAEASAEGGDSYGEAELMSWYLGSGGGAGAHDYYSVDGQRAGNIAGGGGAGGGMIFMVSETSITVHGLISSDGERGDDAISIGAELGGGGGGAGGQILLGAPTVQIDDQVTALGGMGGSAARSTADHKTELVCKAVDTRDCYTGHGGAGGDGRIRLNLNEQPGTGVVDPTPYVWPFDPPERFPCDADGDGFISAACGLDVTIAGQPDCDDEQAGVHPGAEEIEGDGIDSDCDGASEDCSTDPQSVVHGG